MRIIRVMFIFLGAVIMLCLRHGHSSSPQERPGDEVAKTYMSIADAAFRAASYDTAIHYYRRAAHAHAEQERHPAYAYALIRASESARVMEYMDLAESLFEEAERIMETRHLKQPLLIGDLLHLKSNILSDLGDYDGAIKTMNEAIYFKSKHTPRPDSSISMSLNNIGYNYHYLFLYDSAKHYYEKALNQAISNEGKQQEDIAMFLQNIAVIHIVIGNIDSALPLLNQSARIRESLLQLNNPDLGYLYINLGRVYNVIGNHAQAINYNKRAETVFINSYGEESSLLGPIYLNTGNLYKDNGDWNKALDYYRKCIFICENSQNPNQINVYKAFNNIGMIHLQLGNHEAALDYLSRNIDANIEPSSEAITYRALSRTYQAMGEELLASQHMERALHISITKLGPTHYETGNIYQQYGILMQEQGRWESALDYFNQAISVYQHNFGSHHPNLAETCTAKARLYLSRGDYFQALAQFQQALLALVPGFQDTSYFTNPDYESTYYMPNMADPLIGKAMAFQGIFKETGDILYLKTSLHMMEDAISVMDLIRNQLTDQSKMAYSGNMREMYLNGVHTAYQLHAYTQDPKYLETAFMITEKSKYATLLSTMRDLSAREIGGIPDSLKRIEQDIKDQMAAFHKLIYDEQLKKEPDLTKLSRWDSQLFSFKRQHEDLILHFEKRYPHYHNLKYKTDVILPGEIRNILKKDEAVVEYFIGDTSLFTFYITRDDYKVTLTHLDTTLLEYVNTLRLAMTPLGITNTNPESFADQVAAGYGLFEVLLKPGYDMLKGKDILIIPDDVLGYLSFKILLTDQANSRNFDYSKLPYLILKHNISYAYLATLQFKGDKREFNKNPSTIAFAPNYTGIQDTPEEDLISLRGMEKYLLPIKHAKMEMTLLEEAADATIFIDDEANEKSFKQYSPDYDIIHLAMHTVIDDDNPMFSKLVFTILPDQEEDGLLNTFEIYNMNLQARMVVLSACNTGYGQLQKGEGIISLARAFMYAGVPGIVMTLWAIEDKSGYDIMTYFYHYLSKGLSRHESIRKAKIDYLKQAGKLQAHPYFWAAYVTIGDHSPVYPKNRHTTLGVVVCLLALLLIAGGILRGRRMGRGYYFLRFTKIKSILGL